MIPWKPRKAWRSGCSGGFPCFTETIHPDFDAVKLAAFEFWKFHIAMEEHHLSMVVFMGTN